MPSLELRPRLRVIHYAELIWFFFCLGVVVYYLYPLVQTRPFLELLQTQWLVCLFGFVCLFLAVLPFQWKRHYFLRLDGQVLEKWEGWPFCSVQQRIHLGEIESVDVETVIPSSSRHTKEYLAFVLRPKSFTHQEIVHIPLPVGSEEHASEVFLHALRQVIKKRMSFFERRRCLEKVFIPQQGCFRILFALSSSSVFFDEVNKVCEHRMTYCWSLAMWTSWPAAWPAFSLW